MNKQKNIYKVIKRKKRELIKKCRNVHYIYDAGDNYKSQNEYKEILMILSVQQKYKTTVKTIKTTTENQ